MGMFFMAIQKRHIVQSALRKLDSMIAAHRERIADLRSVTVADENQETASQSEDRRGSDIDLLDSYSEQVERLEHEKELLERLDADEVMGTVQSGAVVQTDRRNFIIGPSIEEFQSEGVDYLGLSVQAPLFSALNGRRKGDKVHFKGTDYLIVDVG